MSDKTEIVALRGPNSKTFDIGGGVKRLELSMNKLHYSDKSKGQFEEIDTEWKSESGFGDKVQANDYHLTYKGNNIRFGFASGVYAEYTLPCELVCSKSAAVGKIDKTSELRYTATPDGLKMEIILSEQPKSAIYRIPVKLVGCEIKEDGETLLFVGKDATIYGQIPSPWMMDADGNQGSVTVTYDGKDIVIESDAKWLQSAVYPVTIDPSTTLQVGTANDDGHTYNSTLNYLYTSLTLGLGNGVGSMSLFARFTNVTVPNGATITAAKVQYLSNQNQSGTIKSRIFLNDEDSAVGPTTYAQYVGKTVTSAYVDWNFSTSWVSNTWYDSPDISSVVQEVVDRSGWSSGNAMMILHKDNGTSSGNSRAIKAYTNGGTTNGPKLVIEYTEPVTFEGKPYIGAANVAEQGVEGSYGVGGVARNVLTGYIGVNNVAQPFYQSS